MRSKLLLLLLVTAAFVSGCALFESHPCDGTWEGTVEQNGKRVSVEIYVYEDEIQRFMGSEYNIEDEEILTSVSVFGNGYPVCSLIYNEEADGYWFEYEGDLLGNRFQGHLYPKNETFKASFWNINGDGGAEFEGGLFRANE